MKGDEASMKGDEVGSLIPIVLMNRICGDRVGHVVEPTQHLHGHYRPWHMA